MSLLLYGVLKSATPQLGELQGVNEEVVRVIAHGDVGVVVSDYAREEIAPRRRNLAAFQTVVTRLATSHQMLPVAFGMLAADESAVRGILERNHDLLRNELERIGNQQEYSLRLRWSGENVFAWFVERFEDLRQLRDQFFANGRLPSYDQRIQLGQVFEDLLGQERARIRVQILAVLSPCVSEWREQPYPAENVLASLALLVPREQLERFDQAIDLLAEDYDDQHLIELQGPWPPYSFANLRLQ
jgi:hypothetical protein